MLHPRRTFQHKVGKRWYGQTQTHTVFRRYLLRPKYLLLLEHSAKHTMKVQGREYFEKEAVDILTRLKIEFKMDARAGTLSGGQKRKLSLAIALIGGSEVA